MRLVLRIRFSTVRCCFELISNTGVVIFVFIATLEASENNWLHYAPDEQVIIIDKKIQNMLEEN